MPSGLELLASAHSASKQKREQRARRAAGIEEEPVELDLEHPSAFESTLKTLGLGGNAVRNVLLGNLEGAGRNVVDAVSSPLRALLPGDQSNWELSREQDLPEASELFGGMEDGIGKTAVDVVGGVLTDPLSFIGIGELSAAAKAAKAANTAVKVARKAKDVAKLAEATTAAKVANEALKASRAAGETRTSLGLAPLPFMAPKVEIPGSAAALGYLGNKAGAVGSGAVDLIKKVPEFGGLPSGETVVKKAPAAWSSVKGLFGAQRPSEEIAAKVASAEALGAGTRLAGQTAPVAVFGNIPKDIQRMAVETLRGVTSRDGIYTDLGLESAKEFLTKGEQMALIDQRLGKLGLDESTTQAVREATEKIIDYTRGKWAEGVRNKVFTPGASEAASQASKDAAAWLKINRPLPGGGAGDISAIASDAADLAPADYFPGRYEIPDAIEDMAPVGKTASPSPIKAASIKTSKELADYLTKTKGALESDVGQILGKYGEDLGKATQSASLGAAQVGHDFKALADPTSRKAMNDAIQGLRDIGDHDSANVLNVAFNGLPTPTGFWKTLAFINKPFKAAATAGIIVPRLNFVVGNVVSNVVQFASNPEARKVAFGQLKSLPKVIAGSFADGFKTLGAALPESVMDQVTAAAKASGGTREGMLNLIKDPTLKLAVEHGVLDGGFISAEQLASKFAATGGPKNIKNWMNWTSDVARGSEQRMRFNGFKQLIEAGETPADAARIVDDTLFNYKYSSVANRNARQIAPFGQFMFKAAPQAAKLLAEKPAVAVGLNALYSQSNANDNPVPPWAQGNINLPLGKGPSGNPQYLTSLRMPFETLGKIPNPSGDLGDIIADTQHDVIGQVSPLIKTGIALAGGNDPFSGQPFRSNDRAPAALEALGMQKGSALARNYNAAAGTGAIQPLVSLVNTVSNLLDKRQSAPVAALRGLTGLNIIDVDEQFALKQILEDAIKRDPSIKSSANYYQLQQTPEGRALLQKLQDVRRELKAKKKAASP